MVNPLLHSPKQAVEQNVTVRNNQPQMHPASLHSYSNRTAYAAKPNHVFLDKDLAKENPTQVVKRLYPSILRVLLGQLLLIVLLTALFLGVLLIDAKLVGMGFSVSTLLVIILFLLLICFIHAGLVMKNQPTYLVTSTGIVAEGKQSWSYSFQSIETLTVEQTLLDMILKTGTVVINQSHLALFGMKNPEKIINYINHQKAKVHIKQKTW